MIKITINGEEKSFDGTLSVKELIEEVGLDMRKVAIERNLEIVSRSDYEGVELQDGDNLEIVHFIGGG